MTVHKRTMQTAVANPLFTQAIRQLRSRLTYYTEKDIEEDTIPRDDHPTYVNLMASLPNSQRQYLTVERATAYKMALKDHCDFCWVQTKNCMCSKYQAVNWTGVQKKVEIVFLMTYKEFFRSSNTAKVVLNTLPNTRFLMKGLQFHEEMLQQLLTPSEDRSVYVMFPCTGSLPIHKTPLVVDPEVGEELAVEDTKTYTIIVLDGTWREAKRLNGNITKSLPRIHLSPENDPLFEHLRRQTVKKAGRTSTLEAVVECFREIGMHSSETTKMLENMKILVNTIRSMSNKDLIDFDE